MQQDPVGVPEAKQQIYQ